MASENGEVFIKNLAQFVRTHERALANAIQTRNHSTKNGTSPIAGTPPPQTVAQHAPAHSLASSAFAAALSLGSLGLAQNHVKPAKLTLTPHHLFYLLSRFEELGVDTGPMSVRVENIHTEQSPANYVSFLSQPPKSRGRSDRDSIHSVSSVRSVMSNMSSFWSSLGMGSSSTAAKSEKAKVQLLADLKYLYSAFTKIPCLRLSPDRRARSIKGYEEFPFDTAVPLLVFKNVGALEICDLDFRQFFGWDKLADQLRSLSIKRGHLDDLTDLIFHIVLDDMDKRRRRSSKPQSPPTPIWPASPSVRQMDSTRLSSTPGTPDGMFPGSSSSPRNGLPIRGDFDFYQKSHNRGKSASPTRPSSARQGASYRHPRSGEKIKRSASGSSNSSTHSLRGASRTRSSSNLLSLGILPGSKWRFLRHLSLADNALTSLNASSLSPLVNTLQSLDLSANLFTEVPDCLAALTALRALNLSNCMIDSLHSLSRNPLPAISALNLRSNKLPTIAGIERLLSLERLDIRENRIPDPMEMARLTGIPDMREIWVAGNPFVKPHSNYRITIFNLFRASPGYSEDISIDSVAPGYSERRHLRDRVGESSQPPRMDVPEQVASGKRKKGPRRRLVDLTVEDGCDPAYDSPTKETAPTPILSIPPHRKERPMEIPRVESAASSEVRPSYDDPFISPSKGSTENVPDQVSYIMSSATAVSRSRKSSINRATSEKSPNKVGQKNERVDPPAGSLKDPEYEASWLRVVSDENWAKDPRSQDTLQDAASTHPIPRLASISATGQGASNTSRTLG